MATKKPLTHAQKMERLAIAQKFARDDRWELLSEQIQKDKTLLDSLSPTVRMQFARYLENKQIAQEIERDGE